MVPTTSDSVAVRACCIRPLAAGGRVKAKPVPFMSVRTGAACQAFENVKLCNVLARSDTARTRHEVSPPADGVWPHAGKLLILMKPRCRIQPTQKRSDSRTGNGRGQRRTRCYVRFGRVEQVFSTQRRGRRETNISLSCVADETVYSAPLATGRAATLETLGGTLLCSDPTLGAGRAGSNGALSAMICAMRAVISLKSMT